MDYSRESAGRATKFTAPGENRLNNIVGGLRESLQEPASIDIERNGGVLGIGGQIFRFSMRNFGCVEIWGSYGDRTIRLTVAVSHNLYESYATQYEATTNTVEAVLSRL